MSKGFKIHPAAELAPRGASKAASIGSAGISRPGIPATTVRRIALHLIDPPENNARKHFDEERIVALIESIRDVGLLQPIVLESLGSRYRVAAGERRFRALQRLHDEDRDNPKFASIDAVITDGEPWKVGLIENLLRVNLTVVETAMEFGRLVQMGMSQRELSRVTGVAESDMSRFIKVARLPQDILDEAVELDVATWTMFEVAEAKDAAEQRRLFGLARDGGKLVEVRAARRDGTGEGSDAPGPASKKPPVFSTTVRRFHDRLVKMEGEGARLDVADRKELEALRERIDALLGAR
jgi:ParB/RepB/Spo0J family partition protein